MTISAQDRERISAAIRAAEAKTSGEIVCVLARVSADAVTLPILIAAVLALAAARALVGHSSLTAAEIVRHALEIAGDICVYSNRNVVIEELP